jgi:DNA repair protein RadA/Sms
MSKERVAYSCNGCAYKTIKWLGCCPSCGSWDSFEKKEALKEKRVSSTSHESYREPVALHQVAETQNERICSGIEEWDRVLGGGLVPGSLIVLTGDPGIGKSTLLLQVCGALAQTRSVLYISTEESLVQIKNRAMRLGKTVQDQLLVAEISSVESIFAAARACMPAVLVIDSVQNCYLESADALPGSVTQLRLIVFELMRFCKAESVTVILTGHITKDGIIAGPKTLEHMVDAVFYLQGDDQWDTRLLHAVKNRFGSLQELGFFRMESGGLAEIKNINEAVINSYAAVPGAVLVASTESTRPLLLELQALTIDSKLGIPQRVISGAEHKQVVLIAAILEKYLKIRLSSSDIFFKISGGLKSKSNAIDLGIALALLSSYFQQPLPGKVLACGEISLTGHIKSVPKLIPLLKDAHKFHIELVVCALDKQDQPMNNKSVKTVQVGHVLELVSLFQ